MSVQPGEQVQLHSRAKLFPAASAALNVEIHVTKEKYLSLNHQQAPRFSADIGFMLFLYLMGNAFPPV